MLDCLLNFIEQEEHISAKKGRDRIDNLNFQSVALHVSQHDFGIPIKSAPCPEFDLKKLIPQRRFTIMLCEDIITIAVKCSSTISQ